MELKNLLDVKSREELRKWLKKIIGQNQNVG